MNAEQLLAHYERIADAPDAVARLRRFILDLAVRGKLVPQDPNDEPASKLLQRIAAEKARLVKAGAIKLGKSLPSIEDDEPFDVPQMWIWVRLEAITSYIQRGKSPKYAVSDGSPVISQKCVQWSGLDLASAKQITLESLAEYEEIRFLRNNDLLWNSTGTGTIGRVIRLVDPPAKLVCDSHVTVVRCLFVEPEYVRIWLRSDHVYGLIEERASGSTNQVELTAFMAINQVVPLPPLAEQRRIVARVDELMALCDQLEAARTTREATRDRFAAASLVRLKQPDHDPQTFRDHAAFALEHLAALTARPDQVKALRQTILNLAVCGKLVPQDLNEAVSKEYMSLLSDQQIPSNWRILNFGEFCDIEGGSQPPKSQFTDEPRSGYIRLFQIRDLGDNPIPVYIPKEATNRFCHEGEILIGRYGASVGKIFWAQNGAYNVALAKFVYPNNAFTAKFAFLLLKSDIFQSHLAGATRSAQAGFNKSDLSRIDFPLAPLAEQHRIVAKVDALMILCDKLEAILSDTDMTRRRLLDTLLYHSLIQSDEPELADAPLLLSSSRT